MTILAGLATVTGVFLGLGSLPQATKIFQTKSAVDIAPLSYVIMVLGSSIWILYGLELKSLPIMIPNILGVILGTIILVGWFLYGKRRKKHLN
jgi:MtN3 and saliva related transmembrane protein